MMLGQHNLQVLLSLVISKHIGSEVVLRKKSVIELCWILESLLESLEQRQRR